MNYVAEIPVRLGSKRVPKKNLRMINGKPMLAYAIEACKASKKIDSIFVNSEGDTVRKLCNDYGVNFFERIPQLLEDNARQDEFNYDFLSKVDADNLVMINPVSPLLLPEDIDNAIKHFEENKLDSLIAIREEKLQAFYDGKPLNFSDKGLLPMTQSLKPVQLCAWSICIWNAKKFKKQYEELGYAVFVGNYGLYPLDPIRAIKISSEEDFRLAEMFIKARESNDNYQVNYYE